LADTKIALSDAKVQLNERETEVRSLREELEALKFGELCPKCRKGRLLLIRSKSMASGGLGRYGVEEWDFECDSEPCDFKTTRIHDPHGLVSKHIAKR
jgi:hypothetical protein